MNWVILLLVLADLFWVLFLFHKIRQNAWRLGVLQGFMATRYPGHPDWMEARKVLDELEAYVLAKAMERPVKIDED